MMGRVRDSSDRLRASNGKGQVNWNSIWQFRPTRRKWTHAGRRGQSPDRICVVWRMYESTQSTRSNRKYSTAAISNYLRSSIQPI